MAISSPLIIPPRRLPSIFRPTPDILSPLDKDLSPPPLISCLLIRLPPILSTQGALSREPIHLKRRIVVQIVHCSTKSSPAILPHNLPPLFQSINPLNETKVETSEKESSGAGIQSSAITPHPPTTPRPTHIYRRNFRDHALVASTTDERPATPMSFQQAELPARPSLSLDLRISLVPRPPSEPRPPQLFQRKFKIPVVTLPTAMMQESPKTAPNSEMIPHPPTTTPLKPNYRRNFRDHALVSSTTDERSATPMSFQQAELPARPSLSLDLRITEPPHPPAKIIPHQPATPRPPHLFRRKFSIPSLPAAMTQESPKAAPNIESVLPSRSLSLEARAPFSALPFPPLMPSPLINALQRRIHYLPLGSPLRKNVPLKAVHSIQSPSRAELPEPTRPSPNIPTHQPRAKLRRKPLRALRQLTIERAALSHYLHESRHSPDHSHGDPPAKAPHADTLVTGAIFDRFRKLSISINHH